MIQSFFLRHPATNIPDLIDPNSADVEASTVIESLILQSRFILEGIGLSPLYGLLSVMEPGRKAEKEWLIGSAAEGSPDFGPSKYHVYRRVNIMSTLRLLREAADMGHHSIQALSFSIAIAHKCISLSDKEAIS